MLSKRISSIADFITVLAVVAGSVREMLGLNVILERGQTAAGLDEAALTALIGASPQLDDSLPDHVTDLDQLI